MSLSNDHRVIPRVITVGDSGVGKTALIARMKTDQFFDTTEPTIGAGVHLVEFDIGSDHHCLQIWDTAGQELYRSIIPVYFKSAVFALLVFSITDRKSFEHLDLWLHQIREYADAEIAILLVAAKVDQADRQIEEDEAKRFAAEHTLKIFFTSSLTGQNVQALMHDIALTIVANEKAVNHPDGIQQISPAGKVTCC